MTENKKIKPSLPIQHLPDVSIFFLGGCGEFGSNMTAYLHEDRLFLVDCGLSFSEQYHLGIEHTIPDAFAFIESYGGITAYLLTHGHEDHIGGLPHFFRRFPAPIYGTRWTIGLVKDKFSRYSIASEDYLHVIEHNDKVVNQDISFEWFHVNHSIPMASALIIRATNHVIFHTGDFKEDKTGKFDAPLNRQALTTIGSQGVRLLIADSTNAPSDGFCPPESDTETSLTEVIREAKGQVVFTTFSSNWWRLKIVLKICHTLQKKVFLAGHGVSKTISIAKEVFGDVPPVHFIDDANQLNQFDRREVLIIAGGCQAEHRAALSRIIKGEHPKIKLLPGDRVIFSARNIPGNEKPIYELISQCAKNNVEVITPKSHPHIHVSGHAQGSEIELLLDSLRPRYFAPVHGTFTQLTANLKIGEKSPSQTLITPVQNGTRLDLMNDGTLSRGESVVLNTLYIDSWSLQPMSYETLRERLKIGDSGMVIVTGAIDPKSHQWILPAKFHYRGLPILDGETYRRLEEKLRLFIEHSVSQPSLNIDKINEIIQIEFRRNLSQILVKKPVVISEIGLISLGKPS